MISSKSILGCLNHPPATTQLWFKPDQINPPRRSFLGRRLYAPIRVGISPFLNCTKNIKRLIFLHVFLHFILSDWRKSVTNRAFLTNRRKQNTHIPTCAENQKFPVQQGTAVLLVGMRSSPPRSLDLKNYFILFKQVSSSTVYVIYFCRDCLCVYTFL